MKDVMFLGKAFRIRGDVKRVADETEYTVEALCSYPPFLFLKKRLWRGYREVGVGGAYLASPRKKEVWWR